MKRQSPRIVAIICFLGLAGLAYQAGQQEDAIRRASRSQEKKAEATPKGTETVVKAQGSIAEAAALVPTPTAPSEPNTTSFHLMPDGSPVPPLADSTPKRVKLGVVLFRYKGAQGAAASTRSKSEALVLAEKAQKLAETDFAAAVKQGDRGSLENVGWIGQRILEASVEYAVFSLKKGELSKSPIDTPRGLWVVKRIR